MTRSLVLLAALISISSASATAPLTNTVTPSPVIRNALRVFSVEQAKQHGWQAKCADIAGLQYECVLFTLGGDTRTTINGHVTLITEHGEYNIAHAGCVFQIGFSQTTTADAVIVARGCGPAGLARIHAVLAAHSVA